MDFQSLLQFLRGTNDAQLTPKMVWNGSHFVPSETGPQPPYQPPYPSMPMAGHAPRGDIQLAPQAPPAPMRHAPAHMRPAPTGPFAGNPQTSMMGYQAPALGAFDSAQFAPMPQNALPSQSMAGNGMLPGAQGLSQQQQHGRLSALLRAILPGV